MERTNKPQAQQELSTSVLSRYFNEQTEEPLDYEIEPWDTSSDYGCDDRDEEDEKEVEESEAEDDGDLTLESIKGVFKLARDDYIRRSCLPEKSKVVQIRSQSGRARHGPILKHYKSVLAIRRGVVQKQRITSHDYSLNVVVPQRKVKVVKVVKKRNSLKVKNFIVLNNKLCGKWETLRFSSHQWHHFMVPFGPEVFATSLRLVEEKFEESSAKSEVAADALDCEEGLVRDLQITLVTVKSDGMLERLLAGVCLTDFMFNKCDGTCTSQHHLGGEFEHRLNAVDSFDSLRTAYQFTKRCYAFRSVYNLFIKAMARLKARDFMVKNVIEDIRQQIVIKHVVGVRKVILGLVSTGLQFHEAVHLVIQENDIGDIELSDLLLKIIALHHNLADNWFLVRLLVEKRDQVPRDIVQSLIELCIMQPVLNVGLARNVLKELIVDRNLTDTSEINSLVYSELLILACDEHGHVP